MGITAKENGAGRSEVSGGAAGLGTTLDLGFFRLVIVYSH